MRPHLAALAALVGAMFICHGLVLRDLIDAQDPPLEPAAAALLLIGGGAMGLAALTVQRSPGPAAIEMALAGSTAMLVAGPEHRYLLASGGVALILAVFAAVEAAMPAPRPQSDGRVASRRGSQPAPVRDSDTAPACLTGADQPFR